MEQSGFSPEILIFVALAAVAVCVISFFIGRRAGLSQGTRQVEKTVRMRLKQSRAVLGGLVSEQVAPLLPGFPFDPGDCRFVGKPVDFIVFKGMNAKNISEVIFLEIKSGTSRTLNDQERKLRDVVVSGKVRWAQYDAPVTQP